MKLPRREILAGVGFAVLAAVLVVRMLMNPTETYIVPAGEHRAVTLADGSRVVLDARSNLAVQYSGKQRSLRLQVGQVRADVKPDAKRPFVIVAGLYVVTLRAGSVNVDLLDTTTLVTVLEGEAQVSPVPSRFNDTIAPVTLRSAQQLILSQLAAPEVVSNIGPETATAWEQGKVVLRETPMHLALERMNRYTQKHMFMASQDLGALRITGEFDVAKPEAFLEALEKNYGVQNVTTRGGEVILSFDGATSR